jgi:hypothetical protein
MKRNVPTLLGWLAIPLAVLLVRAGADAGSVAQQEVAWKLVYEHYDHRIGEGGTGIDIVTSERGRPLSLARRARSGEANYSNPALSPDGNYVAYVRSASDVDELYVVRADGSAQRRIAAGSIHELVWSEDSSSLAFTPGCGYDFEGGCRKGRIDLARRDGTDRRVLVRPRNLARSAEIELQDWSRGGDVLYVVRNGGQERLYTVRETGRVPAALADRREDGDLGDASWSSDGQLIAYTRRCIDLRSDTYCDVAVMTRLGGSKRTLVRRGALTGSSWGAPSYDAPTWIPGSLRMLISLWGHDAQTRLVSATTGESRRYSKLPLRNVAVSRSGGRLGAVSPFFDFEHVLMKRLNGSTVERVRLPRQVEIASGDDHDLWVG